MNKIRYEKMALCGNKTMENKVFKEISDKCVEKLNEYFNTCDDEITDRENLNDKIIDVGAEYGITLYDSKWMFDTKINIESQPGLTFVIMLPPTSNGAKKYDYNHILNFSLIDVYKKGELVAIINIDKNGVDITYIDNDVIEEIEEIEKN